MKKIIAWPVAWALYWVGDLMCRPLHTDVIGNGPEWLADIFYRPYNWLMLLSCDVQDWGGK